MKVARAAVNNFHKETQMLKKKMKSKAQMKKIKEDNDYLFELERWKNKYSIIEQEDNDISDILNQFTFNDSISLDHNYSSLKIKKVMK